MLSWNGSLWFPGTCTCIPYRICVPMHTRSHLVLLSHINCTVCAMYMRRDCTYWVQQLHNQTRKKQRTSCEKNGLLWYFGPVRTSSISVWANSHTVPYDEGFTTGSAVGDCVAVLRFLQHRTQHIIANTTHEAANRMTSAVVDWPMRLLSMVRILL